MAEEKAAKKKAKSNAERQREYRKRNMYRINTMVDADAYFHLRALSKHYAVTKREMLQTLLKNEYQKLTKNMTEEEIDALYN